jgi:hypothetical protein
MQLCTGEAILHQEALNGRLQDLRAGKGAAPAMTLPALVATMNTLYRMGEHALGGADTSVSHDLAGRFRNWTDQEINEFWTTGKRPLHDL